MGSIRFLLMRRMVQITLLVLYFGANAYGWHMLEGTFGASKLFGFIPLADPFAVAQVAATGFVLGADVLIGALIIALFYGLIGGRAFCSWVCPVNMVTDLANYLRRKLKLDKETTNYRFLKRSTRYYLAAIALVVSAISGVAAFELISPIGIMQRSIIFGAGASVSILVAIFLFDLMVVKNGWCGHICPMGAAYGFMGQKSAIVIKHNVDNCTGCMDCKVVCPENHVLEMVNKRSDTVSNKDCVNCGRCVDVCNDDALNFGLRFLNNNKGEKNE